MARYQMKQRHARWETVTIYTDAGSEEEARNNFDTGDIEENYDCELGGYVDFIEPETIVEPVAAPVEPPIAPPLTRADRLRAAMASRIADQPVSTEDWIVAARKIGPVVVERYHDAHAGCLCKLTFDDPEVELSDVGSLDMYFG